MLNVMTVKQQVKSEARMKVLTEAFTVDWFCIGPLCQRKLIFYSSHTAQILVVTGAKNSTGEEQTIVKTDSQRQKQKTKPVIQG